MSSNVDELLSQLTLEEKISLLSGANFWETVAIPRLNIPSLKVSDGPNGARGAAFYGGVTAACFPASVSLAATWDRELAQRIGGALAEETKTKGALVLLGPTVCPHRSPLGGRNFESFSEDPFLAGKLAASYINGLQAHGVGATIKHFAGNEQESRRFTMNANISQRALREIYLKPFEIAIKEANPWAVMTSYNLVNGVHADMSTYLLKTVLRREWGWDGLVMSDWGGTNSTSESIEAGLDLEMPGPANKRKLVKVQAAIDAGTLSTRAIDSSAKAILTLLQKTGKFENPETTAEEAVDLPKHRELIRAGGADGIVLLKNDNSILPLKKKSLKTVAALGLAKECIAHGGGSASVACHYKLTPWEALQSVLGNGVDLRYAQGASLIRNLPDLVDGLSDLEGKPGLTVSLFDSEDISKTPTSRFNHTSGSFTPFVTPERPIAAVLVGTFTPAATANDYISFFGLGPSKLYINEKVVLSTASSCSDPMAFLLGISEEQNCQYQFTAGQSYKIRIESIRPAPGTVPEGLSLCEGLLGTRLGFMSAGLYDADLIPAAVDAAKGADVALVFIGNDKSWETEGQDMESFCYPARGSQDKLINAVCDVNPNVIVISSTGVAKSMPWIGRVSAVIQAWYGGQEAGNSIVDVLFGAVNPGGRLPVTFPKSIEDTPSFGNFPGDLDALQVHYKEGIYMGYRHYDRHPEKVLFPFGFGLSYTEFAISAVSVVESVLTAHGSLTIEAAVNNTGSVSGSEVVQVYIAPPSLSVHAPPKQLVGFAKVELAPGEEKKVSVRVGYESLAYFDENKGVWTVENGEYAVLVGQSSQSISGKGKFVVKETFTYKP